VTPGWQVLAPVNLQTVVLRHEPAGTVSSDGQIRDGDTLDAHALSWVEKVNSSGTAFVTRPCSTGTGRCGVSIGAEPTTAADVAELWKWMQDVVS
jgi:aromatic-L-amino-acid decarboxylase